jgi:hypothetical protein
VSEWLSGREHSGRLDERRSGGDSRIRSRALVLLACAALAIFVSGCASSKPAMPESDLASLDIPQDATRTAAPAAVTQTGAVPIRTGAPTSFYVVKPNAESWFAIDKDARVIGWSTLPGTDVGIYLVSADGARSVVDTSGFEQPLATPGPDVSGNAATRRYVRQDQQNAGPGWLVVVPRTYDNGLGVFGIELKSEWK